jgi:formate hydrogenlyase subunit 4
MRVNIYVFMCIFIYICLMFSVNSFTLGTTYVSSGNFRAVLFCGSVQVDDECKGFCVLW